MKKTEFNRIASMLAKDNKRIPDRSSVWGKYDGYYGIVSANGVWGIIVDESVLNQFKECQTLKFVQNDNAAKALYDCIYPKGVSVFGECIYDSVCVVRGDQTIKFLTMRENGKDDTFTVAVNARYYDTFDKKVPAVAHRGGNGIIVQGDGYTAAIMQVRIKPDAEYMQELENVCRDLKIPHK